MGGSHLLAEKKPHHANSIKLVKLTKYLFFFFFLQDNQGPLGTH